MGSEQPKNPVVEIGPRTDLVCTSQYVPKPLLDMAWELGQARKPFLTGSTDVSPSLELVSLIPWI